LDYQLLLPPPLPKHPKIVDSNGKMLTLTRIDSNLVVLELAAFASKFMVSFGPASTVARRVSAYPVMAVASLVVRALAQFRSR
jgi:hypothetical protein